MKICTHLEYVQEEFEDTKGVIRIRKWKNDRQHNGQTTYEISSSLTNVRGVRWTKSSNSLFTTHILACGGMLHSRYFYLKVMFLEGNIPYKLDIYRINVFHILFNNKSNLNIKSFFSHDLHPRIKISRMKHAPARQNMCCKQWIATLKLSLLCL
jgi:hypothetical protein